MPAFDVKTATPISSLDSDDRFAVGQVVADGWAAITVSDLLASLLSELEQSELSIVLKAASGQTTPLFECRDHSGSTYYRVGGKRTLTANGDFGQQVDVVTSIGDVGVYGQKVNLTVGNGTTSNGGAVAAEYSVLITGDTSSLLPLFNIGIQCNSAVTGGAGVLTYDSVRAQIASINSGSRINTYTAFYVISPYTSGGTFGTVYGLRVQDLTAGDTANYAIYTGLGANRFGDSLQIDIPAAAIKGLTVKAAASQTANLFETQNSSGTALTSVKANGGITLSGTAAGVGGVEFTANTYTDNIGIGRVYDRLLLSGGCLLGGSVRTFAAIDSNYPMVIGESGTVVRFAIPVTPASASAVPFAVQGAASQTANLMEWRDSGGTPVASVSAAGAVTCAELSGHRTAVSTNAGTSITLGSGDTGRVVETTSGSPVAVTLSETATVGTSLTVTQAGTGQVTFTAGSGGSLRNRQSHAKTAGQWAVVAVYVRANSGGSAAEWVLSGDTAA